MTLVLFAPVALIYSWYFYFTKMRRESAGWRNRVTLISLALASLAALLLPVMVMLMPVGVASMNAWNRGTDLFFALCYLRSFFVCLVAVA